MRCARSSITGCRRRCDVNALPILDRARLDLITRGSAARADEFLGALLEEADELVARLPVLLANADAVGVSNIAHTLKGMAAELGASRLRFCAEALQDETDPARWIEHVDAVKNALTELTTYVDSGTLP
jgi:two-component system sensor histidine kinase EvgS